MKPEKQNLIHDLLDPESSRENTLLTGARILRRRRFWRAAKPAAVALTLTAIVTVFCLHEKNISNQPHVQGSGPATKPQPTIQVEALSDDQLLALFPNTPVGLASLSGGKKKLVFPRAGDEAKFITRL